MPYNNVLCGNTGDDLHIFVNISVAITLAHNDICSMDTSTVNLIQIANLNMDPGFVGNGDYRLRGDSPLRDAGDNNPPGGTGSVDVGGRARVVFGTVDIGAHELQDSIFSDGFDCRISPSNPPEHGFRRDCDGEIANPHDPMCDLHHAHLATRRDSGMIDQVALAAPDELTPDARQTI